MTNKLNKQVYYCKECSYTTTRKSSWNKHLKTQKHYNAVNKTYSINESKQLLDFIDINFQMPQVNNNFILLPHDHDHSREEMNLGDKIILLTELLTFKIEELEKIINEYGNTLTNFKYLCTQASFRVKYIPVYYKVLRIMYHLFSFLMGDSRKRAVRQLYLDAFINSEMILIKEGGVPTINFLTLEEYYRLFMHALAWGEKEE